MSKEEKKIYYLKCAKHPNGLKKVSPSRILAHFWPYDVFNCHDDKKQGLSGMKKMYGKFVALVEMHTAKRRVHTRNVDWFKGRPSKVIKVFKDPNYEDIEKECEKLKIKLA